MDTKQKTRFPTRRKPVRQAVEMLGGLSEAARLLKVSPQAIHKWCKQGVVPGKRCRLVEALVGGRVTRYALNPEVFGKVPSKEFTGTE